MKRDDENGITPSKEEVFQVINANKERLLSWGVVKLGLFGSVVRNEQKPGSDVDFLAEFEEGCKSFDNFLALATFLEEILGCRVELVTREALSPYIGPRIMQEVEYVDFRS
ncbi:MAG: nucleotidyltransferase [Deltaproteobacteria bacterium]|nr:MAG: nucleotidyltransferase [Deltaproteobacteria bacterium]